MQFAFLCRGSGCCVDSCHALITGISGQKNVGRQLDSAFFEEPEIMSAAGAEGGGKNSSRLYFRKASALSGHDISFFRCNDAAVFLRAFNRLFSCNDTNNF